MTEKIRSAVAAGCKVFDLSSRYHDGKIVVDVKLGFTSGSPRPEKVLESTLSKMQTIYEITREDLLVEKNGTFHSAFTVEREEG